MSSEKQLARTSHLPANGEVNGDLIMRKYSLLRLLSEGIDPTSKSHENGHEL